MQRKVTAHFGKTLRERRLRMGLTQSDLSRITGLNRSYISEIERGKESISLERAAQLASAVNCELWELLKK